MSVKMETTEKGYRLSTGREFSAHRGLISIARNIDGTFAVCEGYDGIILGDDEDWSTHAEDWTADDRRELADFMIAQWTAYKESLG